ncbi:MAG: ClbS/DfsB family four-helix bundle protein [Candidatus Rokuibacteriota bacterium]
MGLKQDLLRQADEEFTGLKDAIAQLGEAEMTRAWLGTWSVREVLVHMSGWHREMIPVFDRLARGEKPIPEGVSYEDEDGWNARFVAAKQGVPTAAVLREFEASHRDFVAAAARVPEERFAPGKTATKLVDLSGPHHYREHATEIRAWRARRRLI